MFDWLFKPAGRTQSPAHAAADQLVSEGNRAEKEGRLREACELYRRAVAAAPGWGKAHLNLGIGLEASGATDEAIKSFEAALVLEPADAFANYNLGRLFYTGGRLPRAEQLLRQALRSRPEFPEAHVVLSRVLESQGNLGAAAAAVEAALKLRPDDIGALYHYAGVLGKLNRPDDAQAALKRVIALDPENADANYSLATLFLARGEPNNAIAILESESSRCPDSFEVWNSLGRAYGVTGRHVEAERAYRNAVRLRPDLHETHYNLAMSLAHQARLRDSIEHFLNARRINPHDAEVRKTLLAKLVTLLQDDDSPAHAPAPKFPPLNERPLVSVIVPTQNRPRMLQDALNSVCRQGYQNWEVIVVNDGGEDVSPVLKSMPSAMQAKNCLIDLRTIHGPAAARNAAIKAAKGEVLAFLDDDDLYLPGHLENLVAGLRSSNAGIACSATELVEETIRDGIRVEVGRKPLFSDIRYSRPLLLVANFIPINTWGVRRECFREVGVFDEALHFLEDWDFLLRLSYHVDFHQMSSVTAEYRVTRLANDSVTKRHQHEVAVRSIYRRYEAHGLEFVRLAREIYLETLA